MFVLKNILICPQFLETRGKKNVILVSMSGLQGQLYTSCYVLLFYACFLYITQDSITMLSLFYGN